MFIKSPTCEYGFLVLQKWLNSTHDRFRQAVLLAEAKERKEYIVKQQKTPVEA
jgi:hypothetical protein